MAAHFSVAVVGADFLNMRGKARAYEVKRCTAGEILSLRLDPPNAAGRTAIAVMSARGVIIGYVRIERAGQICRAIETGKASAIFQCAEPWGASIRVSLDGKAPVLPIPSDSRQKDWPPPMSDDPEWLPDHLWPE